MDKKIAVLIPCYNEAITIEKVVKDFKRELPEADIYVFDNNSSDNTSEIAKKAGAIVRHESTQGKGAVVRTMFATIDADAYLMVDGDDTYPAESARDLLNPILDSSAEMTIGDRLSNGTYAQENTRSCHQLGNNLVRFLVNKTFNGNVFDIMTGYRGFSKKFVKTFPIMYNGFQIETEMTLHALDKRLKLKQIPLNFRERPEGSVSKLNTFSDGFKVLKTIFDLFKNFRPFVFFGILSLLCFLSGLLAGTPVIWEFIKTQYITHIPLAILASGLMIISVLFFICGLILDSIVNLNKRDFELKLVQFESDYRSNK